ncbi:hypothetical protein HHK36_025346 [Tetracentron sinense]|uniref:pectinesterase n=1 Tax=Tetracentron sinense TaxID=13715 RepID=A0A835D3H0_TETSI|nr:hypothetical protein HHK36_025346 [Tetracentron sinense]
MDSINSFKGYGKVDELERQAFRRKTRKRLIIIIISAIVLLTVVIAAVAANFIHKNKTHESPETPSSNKTPAESIKAICSITLYPDSCFSSISSLQTSNKVDPEELFKLSLQVAIKELLKISSLPEKLIAKDVNDSRVEAALSDCESLFEDAVYQLNASILSMKVGQGEKLLTASKTGEIKTWLSTAITDQETCLDGLAELNSTLQKEVKTAMQNSTEFTSNSLAIITKVLTILENFDIPIHRKLLEFDLDFPEWVHSGDRKLVEQANPKPHLTVAKDGSGDYKTIKEAVNSIADHQNINLSRYVIYVKEGVYTENVIVDKSKWNIMMYGDGKTKTIVSGNLSFVDGTPTFSTATFGEL